MDGELTGAVIGAAIDVHRELGPGLLESAYQACMAVELGLRRIPFEEQYQIKLNYKGFEIDCSYRVDLLVANQLIVEIKSALELHPIHDAQVLSYMKATGCTVGLLITFNVPILKQGIRRLVLSRPRPSASSAPLR